MKVSLRKQVRTVRGMGNVWNPQSSNVVAGLGLDFNVGNVLKSYINDVISGYLAKLGRFMTFDEKLTSLANRVTKLASYPNMLNSSASLALDIKNAQNIQSQLKVDGANVINTATAVQKDPLVVDAMAGKLPSVTEIEKWSRLNSFVNQLGEAKNIILSWINRVNAQENTVNDLESRTANLESQVGITASAGFNWKQIPVGVWVGIGFLGIKFAGKGIIKAIKGK